MKIAIIGCGAMGTILGVYLTKAGYPVEMVDNYEAHVNAMNEKGATVTGTVDLNVKVKAITPNQMEGIYDVVFLFTKQTANDIVLPNLLKHLDENSTVCTLQNGVPEPYVAKYVGEERTVGGAVLWSATFIEPGVSQLTQDIDKTDHLFEIGEISGEITPRIQKVANILNDMGRPTHITEGLMASRWGKLVNNACVSGMSAVCGATFGEVLENPVSRACVSYIGREVKVCCEAEGYKLPVLGATFDPETLALSDQAMFEENNRLFMELYRVAWPAKASMLQDLEKGNKTEVKMINGFVCQTGDKHGIETPFNDKVVEIVSRIEAGELTYSMDNLNLFEKSMFEFENTDMK